MTFAARVGACGWAVIGGSRHPVVILRVEADGSFFVVHGTSKVHSDFGAAYTIRPGTPQAHAFRGGLTKDTHFYANGFGLVRAVDACGQALGSTILALRRLVEPPVYLPGELIDETKHQKKE